MYFVMTQDGVKFEGRGNSISGCQKRGQEYLLSRLLDD